MNVPSFVKIVLVGNDILMNVSGLGVVVVRVRDSGAMALPRRERQNGPK